MNKDSVYFKNLIIKRLEEESESLKQQFSKKNQINSFVIDDLLPFPDVEDIYNSFPESSDMKIKKSLREFKSIDAQLDNHNPILEHITFAFQHQDILRIISDITGIDSLSADSSLYAGGISRMEKGNFLNPHLDNSHNNDRDMYRVLNLLFYVTPNRSVEDGGNLELWDNGPRQENRVVAAKYNRLVVMATDQNAWHSVSRVMQGDRCCISNY